MATVPEDQDKVMALSAERGWTMEKRGEGSEGPRVVSCFGYHPWFTHRYTLSEPPPNREEHYRSIFFAPDKPPNERNEAIFTMLLPYLPDPLPFAPLLETLRQNISTSLAEGSLTMLGEVGLDGGARMRWPKPARYLYEEKHSPSEDEQAEDDQEWTRLTPFKVAMSHQKAIVEAQLEVAIDLGVNVSFHSVSAAGPTMDVLTRIRDTHRSRFTNRIKVDIHSGGGWSPQFWAQAERQFLNLYASPSIFITGRSQSAPDLIRAISAERILVESDSHDVRLTTRLVWTATRWIASCKGWRLEDGSEDWPMPQSGEIDDLLGADGRMRSSKPEEVWAVRTLERNWARFMGIIDDTR